MEKLRELVSQGWYVVQKPATAFVGMHHPKGGKFSLVEVHVYGVPLTLSEADGIAAEIAGFLKQRLETEVAK